MNRRKFFNSPQAFMAQLGIITIITLAATATLAADKQEVFSKPEEAVDALINANRSNSVAELLKILGPQAEKLINSGDAAADKESRAKFLSAYNAAHKLESETDDKQILIVGEKEWPLPIPLVRENGKWRFDTAAGAEEILNRRIGRNELNVIEICRAFVEAEREYAATHILAAGRGEYAQRFLSNKGKQNGLYWPVDAGEEESPLGPLLAFAEAAGNNIKARPYHGYYYKILTGQSKEARGGAINYISGGHMVNGFALIAFPARYGDSGIMTFIVNQNGIVHEKDLGPDTAKIVPKIKLYNPDKSWKLPSE